MTPLQVRGFGRFEHVEVVAETESTNRDLAALVEALEPGASIAPRVRFAEHQTAGKGRRDRRWEAPPATALLVSFLVPWADPTTLGAVPMALSLAACEAAASFGAELAIKWPNDLVDSNDRKHAGLLSEVVGATDGRAVVAGLGLNVSWPDDASASPPPNASCLDAIAASSIDRSALSDRLIEAFDTNLDRAAQFGQASLLARQRERSATIGRRVSIETGSETVTGTAVDLDVDGAIIVRDDVSVLRRFEVGDVVHLRPSRAVDEHPRPGE